MRVVSRCLSRPWYAPCPSYDDPGVSKDPIKEVDYCRSGLINKERKTEKGFSSGQVKILNKRENHRLDK